MPWILAGLGWLFEQLLLALPMLVAWFATWMTKRVAIAAAMVVAFLALTTTFYGSVYAGMAGLAIVAPDGFSQAVGMFMPSNTYACVSLYLATQAVRWIYDVQLRVLNYSNPGAGF